MATTKQMLIDGEWCRRIERRHVPGAEPRHRGGHRHAPDATADDMRRAIAAARRAFDEGPWPRSDAATTGPAPSLRIADAMERRKEEMRAAPRRRGRRDAA